MYRYQRWFKDQVATTPQFRGSFEDTVKWFESCCFIIRIVWVFCAVLSTVTLSSWCRRPMSLYCSTGRPELATVNVRLTCYASRNYSLVNRYREGFVKLVRLFAFWNFTFVRYRNLNFGHLGTLTSCVAKLGFKTEIWLLERTVTDCLAMARLTYGRSWHQMGLEYQVRSSSTQNFVCSLLYLGGWLLRYLSLSGCFYHGIQILF